MWSTTTRKKDDWSTGYYGTGSRQQVTDDVFHKLETGEEFTRDDFIKAELALQDAKLEAGIDLEKEKSPGLQTPKGPTANAAGPFWR